MYINRDFVRRPVMNSKAKMLIGLAIGIIIVIGGWLSWNSLMNETNCRKITSMTWGRLCANGDVSAVGVMECDPQDYARKTGVHHLKFGDGTSLNFFEEVPNCTKKYQDQKVEVTGTLYSCGPTDQCAGLGLTNIQSVSLVPGKVRVVTDKKEYRQGEQIEIEVANDMDEDVCFESCNPYYFMQKSWKSGWRSFARECFVSFITECVKPKETKTFRGLAGDYVENGKWVAVVPVWTECDAIEGVEGTTCKIVTEIRSEEFIVR